MNRAGTQLCKRADLYWELLKLAQDPLHRTLGSLFLVLTVNDVLKNPYRTLKDAAYTGADLGKASTAALHFGSVRGLDHLLVQRGHGMKRLVTRAGAIATAQMDGYLIEERLLDRILIQVSDKGDGNLEVAFRKEDQRYLSKFSAAQHAQWLDEAMFCVESGCALETLDGEPAWISDEAPSRPRPCIKAMRPALQEWELQSGLEFLRRN